MTLSRLNLVDDMIDDESTAPSTVLTRIFVASPTPGFAEMVARSLAHDEGVHAQSQQISLADLVDGAAGDLAEIDVVMFEVAPGNDAQIAAVRALLEQSSGRIKFLGVTAETLSLSVAKQLMDAGVHEVMPLNIGRPQVGDAQALAPAAKTAEELRGGDVRNGMIIATTQTRGGIGTTNFVLNLAAMLTERKGKKSPEAPRVAVVDLDFQNGVLGASIDVEDNGSFIGFLKNQELATFDTMNAAMQTYRDRFDVLAAPTELAPLDAMTPEMMASLLDELRMSYDYVILDLPRAVTHWLGAVLSRADQLFVQSDLSVHSVRQARRLKDAFSDDHASLPIETVVAFQKRGAFGLTEAAREAEKFLDQPLRHWITPDERSARRASDKGEPIALSHPKSATVRAMASIVEGLRAMQALETRRTA